MRFWHRTSTWLIGWVFVSSLAYSQQSVDWPGFRGPGSRGVSDASPVPTHWNADANHGDIKGVLWQTDVPGLGHSSPIVSRDRIFLLTAIAKSGTPVIDVNAGGSPQAATDDGPHSWIILCYDKTTGNELWRQTACEGNPKATRHTKATHANSSVCVAGDHVVAFLGSEGLYCYDFDGELRWQRDLGVIDISKYGVGWGYASSPAIANDRIVLVCDDPQDPFLVALDLNNGEEVWRVSRQGVCERSWGTPLIQSSDGTTQVIVNGWPWIVSYDFQDGNELWRVEGGGDNPIPTPFEAHGFIYITNAHGGKAPIYVIRPNARGTLSTDTDASGNAIVWKTELGGSYMSTPVVWGDYLYLGNSNGVIRCLHAKTGEKVYEKRLGQNAGIIASLVAADEKIYCASENGSVYVLRGGPEFEVIAINTMGQPCFATPAIVDGTIYIRTTTRLVAIQDEQRDRSIDSGQPYVSDPQP